MCQCIFDAQKGPALWALVSPTLPSGSGAVISGLSQADCVKAMAASGGLTVLPSFLFTAAAAAGLAVFGASRERAQICFAWLRGAE
jgi:hypothetical protein